MSKGWNRFSTDCWYLGNHISGFIFKTRRRAWSIGLLVIAAIAISLISIYFPYQDPRNYNYACMTGESLAKKIGWETVRDQPDDVLAYGGAVLNLSRPSSLPLGWEATNEKSIIHTDDLDRDLPKGRTSIYPPPSDDCRINTLHVKN